jgi:hypothetical protein
VVISATPVANTILSGQVKGADEPKTVSIEEPMEPEPGQMGGQSAEKTVLKPTQALVVSDFILGRAIHQCLIIILNSDSKRDS